MKTWLWMCVLLVLAVALALVLREHSGNVLIIAQPWRIELSLTFAVLLLLAAFVVLYVALRLIAWLVSGPERFRSWRGLRGRKKEHELLESGWISVLEGRYADAEQRLSKLLGRSKSANTRVLAGLALATASHHLGEYARRDDALRLAGQAAGNDTRLKEAHAAASAEMLLEQNRPQEALALLQPLYESNPRHSHAAQLLLKAYRQLGEHQRVFDLARTLLRRGVIDKSKALPLIESAAAVRLAGVADPDGFKAVWGELKSDERTLPEVALAAAAFHERQGDVEAAGKVLEAALNVRLESRLLNAYSQCPPEHVARRLAKAEVWLKNDPQNSDLLAALGNLCLTGQLWGPGERYLLRSMKIRSDVRIHALLGNLYDRLGREADAMKHWRLASSVAGVLPVLQTSNVLPAADTRADPTLIDVESMPMSAPIDAEPFSPVAASAADYFDDSLPSASPGEPRTPPQPASVPVSGDSDMDEYFDSAPIPGVDLSQTSDRPRSHAPVSSQPPESKPRD
ncbi:heme biosynthesis HemY N-terminal domain-containing protein [Pusillimonas noertemannii]|uniref:heme biosynthesis HemY N-terminal domain-containing protein n=1 Tax=Pusillimonas noertemannii TaxID=305977 RepID=UPI00030BD9C4|nr:heme biosynthesis HemY N-terminal domain-containing protein [Pusillimonas noertemannii]